MWPIPAGMASLMCGIPTQDVSFLSLVTYYPTVVAFVSKQTISTKSQKYGTLVPALLLNDSVILTV